MPITSRHKQQRGKNLTLFAVLVGIMILLFALSYQKMTGQMSGTAEHDPSNTTSQY